jgi:hypothetical protein
MRKWILPLLSGLAVGLAALLDGCASQSVPVYNDTETVGKATIRAMQKKIEDLNYRMVVPLVMDGVAFKYSAFNVTDPRTIDPGTHRIRISLVDRNCSASGEFEFEFKASRHCRFEAVGNPDSKIITDSVNGVLIRSVGLQQVGTLVIAKKTDGQVADYGLQLIDESGGQDAIVTTIPVAVADLHTSR